MGEKNLKPWAVTFRDADHVQRVHRFDTRQDAEKAGLDAIAAQAVNVWIWVPVEYKGDGAPKNIFRLMPKLRDGKIEWVRTSSMFLLEKYLRAAQNKAVVTKDRSEQARRVKAAILKAARND